MSPGTVLRAPDPERPGHLTTSAVFDTFTTVVIGV